MDNLFHPISYATVHYLSTPNPRIPAECSNHLSYQGQTFAVPWFWTLALTVQIYFEVKSTFEILTVCGQQHSFSTHERMFLWKCQSFGDRKCLDLRGTRTSNHWINSECSNHLSYQGQTFAVPWFWTPALAVICRQYFQIRVQIKNVHILIQISMEFDTRRPIHNASSLV